MTYVSCSTWWIVRCFVRPKFAFLANTPSWTVCVWITVQTTGLQRVGVGRTQERMRIRRLCPPRSQILLHHVVPSYSCFPGYCASQRPLLLPPLVYLKVCRTESAVLPTPGRVSHCKEIIFWTFCPYLDRTVTVKLTGVTLGIQAATHHIWPKWWPQELGKKEEEKQQQQHQRTSFLYEYFRLTAKGSFRQDRIRRVFQKDGSGWLVWRLS